MAGSLTDALAQSRDDERRRAARAILRRPLLRADGPDAESFALVQRHSAHLRAWFHTHAGWPLLVTPELARLTKTTDADGPDAHTHPAVTARPRRPFTRRRYVLACLLLAVLSRADAQITLGGLADDVLLAAADPGLAATGLEFTLDSRTQRGDLAAAVRLLIEFGVLSRVAGDEDQFVEDTGDVLYDVHRRALAGMLASARGPSTIVAAASGPAERFAERLARLTFDPPAGSEQLGDDRIRRSLTRRLLDDPVVYYDDLSPRARSLLDHRRAAMAAAVSDLTGLVPEVRAEGIAMVDPDGTLTDVRMPEGGTDGHAALLLATHLAAVDGPVRAADLEELIRSRAHGFATQGYWRRGAADPGADRVIVRTALDRLEALGLVRRGQGADGEPTVLPRPAIARYAVAEPAADDNVMELPGPEDPGPEDPGPENIGPENPEAEHSDAGQPGTALAVEDQPAEHSSKHTEEHAR
ncbi:TIGR02678 family protein [Tomitella cavernea]|uniref:TIGR02678 family protein n=1 Tax=Tomitella cavernea TaxID=1387982 RepID=A0ABP9CP49_9ACTN|nr:TIGR02678 family protein [Tomitella cavernea]